MILLLIDLSSTEDEIGRRKFCSVPISRLKSSKMAYVARPKIRCMFSFRSSLFQLVVNFVQFPHATWRLRDCSGI